MLKTNSKKARENVRRYIVNHEQDHIESAYGMEVNTERDVLKAVYEIFLEEKRPDCGYYSRFSEVVIFEDWARGLALSGLFLYYYNRSAVEDLGAILEETDAEKKRFSATEAESMLTRLIYNEVRRAAK